MKYIKVLSSLYPCYHLAAIPDDARLEPDNYPNPEIEISEKEFYDTKKIFVCNMMINNFPYALYKENFK